MNSKFGFKSLRWIAVATVFAHGDGYCQSTWSTLDTGSAFDNFDSLSADGQNLLGSSFFFSNAWGGEAALFNLANQNRTNLGCLDPLTGPYPGSISHALDATGNLGTVIGTSITPCVHVSGHYDEYGNPVHDSSVTSNYYGGFRWTASGGMQSIGSWSISYRSSSGYSIEPGQVTPRSISENGSKIVGEAWYKEFSDSEPKCGAFLWKEGSGLLHLPSISGHINSCAYSINPDGNVIVGQSGGQACIWLNEEILQLGNLPGFVVSLAKDTSDDGRLVAGTCGSNSPTTQSQAFVWSQSKGIVGLGSIPGWESSEALAVASDGSFIIGRAVHWYIGGYTWTTGEPRWKVDYRAFIWDEQHGIRDLETMLAESHGLVFDWRLGTLKGMSDGADTFLFDSECWKDWMGNYHRTDLIRLSAPLYELADAGTQSPAQAWRLTNFCSTSNSGDGSDLNDFDNDGLANILEYAFGGNPKAADAASLCPAAALLAGKLRITFPCDSTCTDITYTVQASTTCEPDSWTDIARSIGGGVVTPVGVQSMVSDSGTGRRTATVTASPGVFPAGRGFLRIKVSE